MKFSFGSDPEFMLKTKDGKYKSAIGVILGEKDDPLDLGGGHGAFPDNVLAECNIAPSNTKAEAVSNFGDCFKRYAKLVNPFILTVQASQNYPVEELQHPSALEFACVPDYCAYLLVENTIPSCAKTSPFRTCGAHIHLGGNDFPLNDDYAKWWVARMLDLFAAVPSLFIDQDLTSVKRRGLYGAAGAHRPKNYGVEYRSLGNYWLLTPKHVEYMWDTCDFVLNFIAESRHEGIYDKYDFNDLVRCINTSDKSLAKKYMDLIKEELPVSIWKQIDTLSKPKNVDFYKSWSIK